jgi:hypothetical protein
MSSLEAVMMDLDNWSAKFSTVVERGRGKGESDVDLTGDSSDTEEEEMFEAQRVTVGELTKCDERVY